VEADPHAQHLRDEFENHWSLIEEGEKALRTEKIGNLLSDESLSRALNTYEGWVRSVLAAESSSKHE
jgi:hypothetical protein